MREWWQWSPLQGSERLGFAVVGVGRFGIAVCRELLQNGAEVLAVDRSERAIAELQQLEPTVEARWSTARTRNRCAKPACLIWAQWWWR